MNCSLIAYHSVVDVNGHGQCNTDTVSIPINPTQQPSTATNTVSTPLVPVQRPSTTLVGRNQTMSSAASVADTNVYGQHNNNTVATTINLSQQPSTATTLTVQRPNIKASPPESFSGEKARLVGDWLAAVKRYLMLSGVEETKWVAYAVTMLTSTALSWWNSIESFNPNKSTLDYRWEEFIGLVRERFVPVDSEAVAMSKMSHWKQTGSVANYISQFQSFDQLIPNHRLDEEMRVQMFIQGLKPECRLIVNMWEPKTLQQVYKMALKFDNNQRQSLPKFNQFNPTRINRNPTANQQEGTRHNPITIYNTELQNDPQTTISEEEEEDSELGQMREQNGRQGVCFYCKSPDHYRNTCPKLKSKLQIETQARQSLARNRLAPFSKN